MTGIVISIDPVIMRIGSFELRWYGLAVAIAVIVAMLIMARQIKKKGISIEEILPLTPWLALGAISGARLFHVVDYWTYYIDNPLQIWQLQQGGLAIWGALIGGIVAALIYGKVKRISLVRLGDALVPGLLVGLIIGRVGCIINGDAYGGITDLPWGFIYTHPDVLIPNRLLGVPTHPYPVYDMLWNAAILMVVIKGSRYLKKDGFTFLIFLVLYSVGRLVLSFVRQENVILWGLQQAQVIAIFVLIFSLIAMIYQLRKGSLFKGFEQRSVRLRSSQWNE